MGPSCKSIKCINSNDMKSNYFTGNNIALIFLQFCEMDAQLFFE